jgi:uncharacterized membrane protein
MAILPAGFALPALPYLVGLLAAAAVAGGLLYRRRPPVTESTVAALTPWMAAGGAMYAMFQAGLVPGAVAPLFGSPAVYVTVGVVAAALWAGLSELPADGYHSGSAPGVLGAAGAALAATAVVAAVGLTAGRGLQLGVSALIVGVSGLVAAVTWTALRRAREVSAVGVVGPLVIFGHALDGVSTAVGYELLGFGEQVPLSALLIGAGEALPTAEFIGGAWLFVVVKLLVAAVVVVLFDDYVRESPPDGYLLLGVIVAVGLGPGFHNLVLFAIV